MIVSNSLPMLLLLVMVIVETSSIFSIVEGQQTSTKIQCDQKEFERQLDKLLVITSNERNFPEDKQQLRQFCSDNTKLFQTITAYKNQCLKETLKNFVSIIVYSIRGSMKRICAKKSTESTLALIDSSSCINRNKNSINNEFEKLLSCFADVMRKTGCEDKLPVLIENITGVTGNFMNSMCGEYNSDSDKCDHLPTLTKSKPISTNFVTNIVDFFNSV
ncbi:hypothetical protein QR98_0057390 [Sarcoptes scabiei]|uniref:Uncharacterized protein n=1 Tax=Sarcoptes scabiei TaxID=52283 RepID=A0A132A9X6_SARSC|nr:hypothetical protein QR98_0057390 [Sarcoptes scabiei]